MPPVPTPLLPRYGDRSLADLVPSLMAAAGAPGTVDRLGVGPVARACLLVVDGLGWHLLRDHADLAPVLASAAGEPLTAGFPSTTAASLSSIGTGLPPGEHGLVGYTMSVPGHDRAMNVLLWELYGHGPHVDLRHELPPEQVQPERTAFERAVTAGLRVTLVGPRMHAHSGMTRAALRGGRYRPAFGMGDVAVEAARNLAATPRGLVYAYHADLDLIGHVRGTGSDAWRAHLRLVDLMVATLAERLPADAVLVVTGDHGMVDVDPAGRIDVDEDPALRAGVRLVAGEPRARHVHVEPGAEGDVLAAWRERLGDRAWVASRDEAITAGWFGPQVPDRVRPRIGDVIAAARDGAALVQRAVDPLQAGLVGHHGSMTAEEQLVPFVVVRR